MMKPDLFTVLSLALSYFFFYTLAFYSQYDINLALSSSYIRVTMPTRDMAPYRERAELGRRKVRARAISRSKWFKSHILPKPLYFQE